MNQAAKDAVELIDGYKKELGPDGGPQYPVTMSVSEAKKIIAGLELLRGVAAGKDVIRPVEPTPKQHEAGHKALDWYNKMTEQKQVQKRSICDTIYRAMIMENE